MAHFHVVRSSLANVKKSKIHLLYANERNTSDFVYDRSFLKTLTFKQIFVLNQLC